MPSDHTKRCRVGYACGGRSDRRSGGGGVGGGGGDAFDSGEGEGVAEQAGALHADADDAEAETVAGRGRLQGKRNVLRLEKNRGGSRKCASGTGGAMEELTAGKIFFHGALLEA